MLTSRWAVSLAGTAILAGIVWVFGPLWPLLELALPRLVAGQTLLVAWAVGNALLDWRRRSRSAALDAGLAAAGEEGEAVGGSLAKALARLRAAGGNAALTELPIYAIIGPPGAGKTTALQHAGLRFTGEAEAADGVQAGRAPVAGVGGTRMCEWWFTRDAVLIDTAGRYTTQDSDAAVDRAGWAAFLALLRRTRPQQPLNGVIVAIALPDVVQAGFAEQDAHAAAVASRIAELERAFGLRMPVYALFTKADLIAGFTEFFDGLDEDGRSQVWGNTFPLDAASPAGPGKGSVPALAAAASGASPGAGSGEAFGLPARFAAGHRALAARLSQGVLPRLGAEHRLDRRAGIMAFPAQFASLEAPLARFIGAAFGAPAGNAAGRGAWLRGVYFASGTQEGTPVDRLAGAMARAFGVRSGRPAALRPVAGRSYFLARLLREVVFGEAMLVSSPPRVRRRRALLRGAGFAAILLALGGAVAAMGWSARDGAAQVGQVASALAGYGQAAAPSASDPVADGDLRPLAAVLDQARALAAAVPDGPVGFGFGQSAKLQAGAQAAYRNSLAYGLLPRLVWQLESELRGASGRPDQQYTLTRVYLMLGGAGPLDPAQVRDWMERDLSRAYPGPADAPMVAGLLGHLDALLAEPLPPVGLNGPLVAEARAGLQQVPLAARVYGGIASSAAAAALPAWRPFDPLGLAGVTVFTRASGRPMTDGIPGFYTADGYRTVLRGSLAAAARRTASEAWVAGRMTEFAPSELLELERAVTALYLADFTARWDAMLADLNVAPFASLPQATQALYVISARDSPMRALLRSIAAQVALPDLGQTAAAAARYAGLAGAAGGDGAALERSLRLIADVEQQFAKIAALPVGTALPPGGEGIGASLQADAARQPQPLGRWLSTIASGSQALRAGDVRRQAVLAFNAPGGPAQACAAAVARYPFAPSGPQLGLDEFTRVFGPGGLLDSALNTQLKPYVDTSAKPWRLLAPVTGATGAAPPPSAAPLTPADVAQFQRAAAIREAMFPAGQSAPLFQVQVTPAAGSHAATLAAGGALIESGKGQPRVTQVSWPPPAPFAAAGAGAANPATPGTAVAEASLAMASPPLVLRETGLWALHRLFARGRMEPSPKPGRQVVTFGTPPAAVSYELVTAAPGPFAPGLFTGFLCPAVQ